MKLSAKPVTPTSKICTGSFFCLLKIPLLDILAIFHVFKRLEKQLATSGCQKKEPEGVPGSQHRPGPILVQFTMQDFQSILSKSSRKLHHKQTETAQTRLKRDIRTEVLVKQMPT